MRELCEMLQQNGIYLLAGYLGVSTALDLASKKVSVTLTGVFLAIGLTGNMAGLIQSGQIRGEAVAELLLGLLPGLFLLAVSLVTRNQLGRGDALAFLVCGIFLGLYRTILLLMLSLFVTGVLGCFCILLRRVSYRTALPWMPFVFAGFLFMELTGAFRG